MKVQGEEASQKNSNTFAKRKREMDKKAKAEAKRGRRINENKTVKGAIRQNRCDGPITSSDHLILPTT